MVLDASGYHVYENSFNPTATFLVFSGLKEGIYYLFWDYPASGQPTLNAPLPSVSVLSFCLRNPTSLRIIFFAVNNLDVAANLLRTKVTLEDEFTFPFEALLRLGIRRMRVDLSSESAAPRKKQEYDFQAVDQVLKTAEKRGVRIIAMLGQDAEYADELLKKYEFQFDEFTLRLAAKQSPADFLKKPRPSTRP